MPLLLSPAYVPSSWLLAISGDPLFMFMRLVLLTDA